MTYWRPTSHFLALPLSLITWTSFRSPLLLTKTATNEHDHILGVHLVLYLNVIACPLAQVEALPALER